VQLWYLSIFQKKLIPKSCYILCINLRTTQVIFQLLAHEIIAFFCFVLTQSSGIRTQYFLSADIVAQLSKFNPDAAAEQKVQVFDEERTRLMTVGCARRRRLSHYYRARQQKRALEIEVPAASVLINPHILSLVSLTCAINAP
jgi:hypothetical protein